MYNNTIEAIIKSIKVTYATSESCFDFKITVGENEFKFEICDYDIVDAMTMNGNDISVENLTDMFFKIDGEFTALGDIQRRCMAVASTLAEEWLKFYRVEQELKEKHIAEISSPRLMGRI